MNGVLVTGAAGFAGSHLIDRLARRGLSVTACHRVGGRRPPEDRPKAGAAGTIRWAAIDLLDRASIAAAIAEAAPSVIFHLAGAASVSGSWDRVATTLETNALGTHHLLEAVRQTDHRPRILVTSSALVYRPSTDALAEDHQLAPATPYGVSKLAEEMIALCAAQDDGLSIVVARPFNHVGPHQLPSYALASFAQQIARIEAGLAPRVLRVGNLDTKRDVTDVRDTVRAYELLAERGQPRRCYNVSSGRAVIIGDVLASLLRLAKVEVSVEIDDARLRPQDHPVLVGDPSRIREEIGWHAEIPLEQTLSDLLTYWRSEVRT
jgi:GDP-4-dehydro-6-deoxy-D-mannose reductase